jgi:alkanesulfonate monooxygenase SsuD/methylene tetrahydromethanopterin reductase-like flavin-dependent oxidoreductase (luciferase family)
VEFGIFDHLDASHLPLNKYYEDRLRLIELYDQVGFHGYHVAEHHATNLGMAPSPNVFLSAVAQRTKRLRFGPMVYALPLYHALRLAEEIAMLDQMSNGRLEIGFGRGSSPTEIAYFGVEPAATEEVYQKLLPRILAALESGIMHVEEQEPPYRDIALRVGPLQKPYPPVWYGVHTVESADRAARRGWHTISLDMADESAECNEVFVRVWREVHGARPLPLMGLGRFVVVAPTDEEALTIARRAYPIWHAGFTHLFRIVGRMMRHPRPDTWDQLHAQGKGVAGTPETVTRFLRAQLEESGCNYCVGQFAFGDQTTVELHRSVSLFADHVMPRLRALTAAA